MRGALVVLAILVTVSAQAAASDLRKLSLDDTSTIGMAIETDPRVKIEGKGSVRITTKHPTTVCIGEVTGLDIEDAALIYKAMVKSNLEGGAYLEMLVHVGGGQYFSKGMNDPIIGESDWRLLQTPFIFQVGQNPGKVLLNIVINGKGTVWIDDVVLSETPLN
jgi:hypothetical protein